MPDQQVDATRQAGNANKRALVLAGGGAAGNAWELGLIAGLSDAGVDVTEADLIIGTSAGSTVAAQITSGTRPAELYAAILAEVPQPRLATPDRTGDALRISRGRTTWSGRTESSVLLRMRPTCAAGWAPRRSKWMLPTALARRAGATSSRLGFPAGTGRNSLCLSRLSMRIPGNRSCSTATAESIWWTPSPPAPATASVPSPYRIGENRYINGGYRRSENADLAAGYGRVLVLSPFGGRSRMPLEWGMDLATQVDELRAGGSRVETVFPDGGAGDVFDANAMDPSTRPQAARGGYDQGRALAEQLAEVWR